MVNILCCQLQICIIHFASLWTERQRGGNGSDASEFFKAQGSRKKYLRFKRKLRRDKLYIEHFEARSRYDSVELHFIIILTTRSNWMLHPLKPGPALLTGFVGVWLPMMTRGVLPK